MWDHPPSHLNAKSFYNIYPYPGVDEGQAVKVRGKGGGCDIDIVYSTFLLSYDCHLTHLVIYQLNILFVGLSWFITK